MNGVTIIDTIYTYEGLISPIWILIFLGIDLLIFLLGMLTIKYDKISGILIEIILVTMVMTGVCIILNCIPSDKITGVDYYKVSVSDDISLNEFYKTYKILKIDENNTYYVQELK